MTPLLSIENLAVEYRTRDGWVPAVRDLSFAVQEGDRVGLVGESGSGKSTVAMAVMHYLGRTGRMSSGTISYRGNAIQDIGERALQGVRGGEIAMVYQEPAGALNPSMTIGRQLIEVPITHMPDITYEAADAKVREMLVRLELPDVDRVLTSYAHQLSGGQLQRIVIGMALLGEPSLLILDEPTTALDAVTEAAIAELVARICADSGISILLISHNIPLVAHLCDRLCVMQDGRLVEQGPSRDLLDAPKDDYTRALLDGLSRRLRGRTASEERGGSTPVLAVEGLGKRYAVKGRWGQARGAVDANVDISVSVQPGETLAIVGESGSGKSTLGRIVAGLETASDGRVLVKDDDLASVPVRRRTVAQCRSVQMVFQDPDASLNPRLTVGRQLARAIRKLDTATSGLRIEERLVRLLEAVELPAEFAARYPRQLSGGQKQRVAIARAFAGQPDLVVADEPVAALDLSIQATVLDLLKSLQREHGTALLLITHDLSLVRGFADRVAVMQHGRIVEQGAVADLFAPPHNAYTATLIEAARTFERDLPDRLTAG